MALLRDNALISNIQLSLLGIILVVGVFYIWRSLSRLEDKLDAVSESLLASPAISRSPMGGPGGAGGFFGLGAGDDAAMDEDAERFMDNVFGNIAYSAAASGARSAAMPPPVIVEEEDAQDAPATPEAPAVGTPMPTPAAPVAPAPAPIPVFVGDDAETEAENPLSKSKIRRMNADALREVCREHGLPVDGTRAVLTDRIIDKLYS